MITDVCSDTNYLNYYNYYQMYFVFDIVFAISAL